MENNIKIRSESLASITSLEKDWCALEATSECHFFLSWLWIENWIHHHQNKDSLIVLYFEDNNSLLGIALATRKFIKRMHFFKHDAAILYQTDDYLDNLTPEYTGIVCKQSNEKKLFDFLVQNTIDGSFTWGTTTISLCVNEPVKTKNINSITHTTYQVNLTNIQSSNDEYLSKLSSNTRRQIKRSKKEYKKLYGDLKIIFPSDKNECINFFYNLLPLHQEYWRSKNKTDAFYHDGLISFHEDLINKGYPDNLYIVKIQAGTEVIGYIYNFKYNERIYNYQSGLCYPDNNKLKPGLTSHALLIDQHIKQGDDIYDFMAGDYQYKRSLSTEESTLYTMTINKPSWKTFSQRLIRIILRRNK